ncbi:MAG: DUF4912 domain-containing protein [Candidatus Omnitrophota bacterium]|nr:DUF4912 domain-containing protein [Candidatus Omnitrophota bacterium]MBU1929604.1 DUF4912 domain-containing protein [Candidatus Omnitrophota bacterium]MBU2034797.1 DUF4912 domain-containing protein [Candidatus Omnitrophota bacterium]MBU2222285.1 DUF4912 domain-containing protein [Candidatus Omnitrophota bacterium]MBU2258188.1 DUF4912 domain-containing protein [Candidatus Omnitrophota bacterium]
MALTKIRKIKNRLSRIVPKKKKTAVSARRKVLGAKRKGAVSKNDNVGISPKDMLGIQQIEIEKAKFSFIQAKQLPKPMPHDLPGGYNKDEIILQIRDPWWLYSYWEVTLNTWAKLKQHLKDVFQTAKKTLRVYDVSQIIFNGKNAHKFFDIETNHDANAWYIDAAGPGKSWCVDYGLKLPNGEFITIVRSNTVQSPLDGPSWITDEEWMIPEEIFGRLYGMGIGLGQSSPGKGWQERMKKALFSGILASPGMASMASPVKKAPKLRKFWLVVDCELIVYGATEPDALVTVQGKPIKLRPDGTFTLRYALPDGKQVIPVKAVASDELEERTITPIVSRETKSSQVLK